MLNAVLQVLAKRSVFTPFPLFARRTITNSSNVISNTSSILNTFKSIQKPKLVYFQCHSISSLRISCSPQRCTSIGLHCYTASILRLSYKRNTCSSRFLHLSRPVLLTSKQYSSKKSNTTAVLYICSMIILMLGLSYLAVPLYRMFCQATGLGGDPTIGHKFDQVESMEPIRERKIHVSFNADHHASMQWNFKPSQNSITVVPGETALAFYSAKNPTDKPIVGIATYNVLPFQAGLYFNKIQCFCFDEQWLNPHEEVDMPVFFYIDPDFDDDPQLANVDNIVLSYTFFKAEEGQTIPLPGFMQANSILNVNQAAEEKQPSD